MAVRVITDSASDLPDGAAADLGIDIVPLSVRFGAEEMKDRSISPEEFWDRCAKSPTLPETSAPSPGDFETAFRAAQAAGADGVVVVTLSSKLSATFQSAQLAADAVKDAIDVRVVDSQSVSMGEGLTAMAAAEAAGAAKGVDDVAAIAADAAERTRVFAALDTLENLKKGGRIGGAQALLGSLLSIKPIIEIRGTVEPEAKQRTRSKSIAYLADKVKAADVEALGVVHGHAPDVDDLLALLAESHPRDSITVSEVGAVIGAHAGPRILGVTFRVRQVP